MLITVALDDLECEACGHLIEKDTFAYESSEGVYHESCWEQEPDIDKIEEEREQD